MYSGYSGLTCPKMQVFVGENRELRRMDFFINLGCNHVHENRDVCRDCWPDGINNRHCNIRISSRNLYKFLDDDEQMELKIEPRYTESLGARLIKPSLQFSQSGFESVICSFLDCKFVSNPGDHLSNRYKIGHLIVQARIHSILYLPDAIKVFNVDAEEFEDDDMPQNVYELFRSTNDITDLSTDDESDSSSGISC